MVSTIQRLLLLFALVATSNAFMTPANSSVAPRNPVWASILVANLAGADKYSSTPAIRRKIPCPLIAGGSHRLCPVCSKSVVLRSVNRTRVKMPGVKPRVVTGVPVYKQLTVAAELTASSLNSIHLVFGQSDFAFGEIFARTGRLRI